MPVGGHDGQSYLNSVERYATSELICSYLFSRFISISTHCGRVGYELCALRRYCPQRDEWLQDVASTSSSRTSVGCAVVGDAIYAVGGQDGVSCLNLVERYDLEKNRWDKQANMNCRRLGVGVCVLDRVLFAIGGSDGNAPLSSGIVSCRALLASPTERHLRAALLDTLACSSLLNTVQYS